MNADMILDGSYFKKKNDLFGDLTSFMKFIMRAFHEEEMDKKCRGLLSV